VASREQEPVRAIDETRMKERRTTLPPVEPGKIIGQPKDWTPEGDADHFMQCPGCGEWIDMRDLGMARMGASYRMDRASNVNEDKA